MRSARALAKVKLSLALGQCTNSTAVGALLLALELENVPIFARWRPLVLLAPLLSPLPLSLEVRTRGMRLLDRRPPHLPHRPRCQLLRRMAGRCRTWKLHHLDPTLDLQQGPPQAILLNVMSPAVSQVGHATMTTRL